MKRHFLPLVLATTALALAGCTPDAPLAPDATAPILATAPAEGGDRQIVIEWDFSATVDCGDESISSLLTGWAKVRFTPHFDNHSPRLDVYQVVYTYTNDQGDRWVYHAVGPARFWQEGDFVYLQETGRVEVQIGLIRYNLLTGEVLFVAGPSQAPLDDQACAALT